AAQAQNDHAGFFLRTTQGRPWVTLKLAQSLDGRIATAQGESRWITGPAARRHVHMDRLRHDAVMIGAGTARADDPSLTVRDLGPVAQPVRVVVSGRLDLPTDSVLARTARQVPVWLMHGPDAPDAVRSQWDDLGARRFALPDTSPDAVLQALGTAGLTRIYCEGGGQLAASLLRAGRVDELVSYAAGLAIGGDGRASLAELGIDRLAQMPRFDLVTQHDVGGDVLHRWRRRG
ncbi:MAG: RibD family protein, partial [Primorskyibacter sp.]